MELLAKILIGFVAVEHVYILWLEMFGWTTKGKKVFRSIPEDMFEKTKVFVANQGLYNGLLASMIIFYRKCLLIEQCIHVFLDLRGYRRNLWRIDCPKIDIFQTRSPGTFDFNNSSDQ